jgi:hypothetical protein
MKIIAVIGLILVGVVEMTGLLSMWLAVLCQIFGKPDEIENDLVADLLFPGLFTCLIAVIPGSGFFALYLAFR